MSVVIKAGQAGKILPRLSTVDLADHLREARAVVEAARQRASNMIDDAQTESKPLWEKAKKEGYQSGYDHGRREGSKAGHTEAFDKATQRFNREQASMVEAIEIATRAIKELKHDLEVRARQDLLEFAMACAAKLTFQIGTLDRKAAQANLDRALALVSNKTNVRIRVNPADLESIKTYAPSILIPGDEGNSVVIEADDAIHPGGCLVASQETEVDATLQTQLDQLVTLLLGKGASV